jgi:hypothetical protein
LDAEARAAVTAEQRALDARAQTPIENIRANAAILRGLNVVPEAMIHEDE